MVLPTLHDIVPLPSPPESLRSDDLEAGHGHGVELSMSTLRGDEDLGLVSATRRTGKSIQREASDVTTSSLPLSPTPPSDNLTTTKANSPPNSNLNTELVNTVPIVEPVPVQAALAAKHVPDLLTDPTLGAMEIHSAPPLKPSPSFSSFSTGSHTPQKETEANEDVPVESSSKETNEENLTGVEPTIRLIGGGGHSGVSQMPMESTAEELPLDQLSDSSSPHSNFFSQKGLNDVAPVVTSVTEPASSGHAASEATPALGAEKKGHKKSKGSLASLKRFSVSGLGKKKDPASASSMKDVTPSSR